MIDLQQLEATINRLIDARLKAKSLMASDAVSNDADHLVSVATAAARYDVSESFIRKKVAAGKLEVQRVGRAVRIRVSELEKLVTQKKANTSEHDIAKARAMRIARGA